MTQPKSCPPLGLHYPASYIKALDGDTVEASFFNPQWIWRFRLIDTWAPENDEQLGAEATKTAQEFIAASEQCTIHIPLSKKAQKLIAKLIKSYNPLTGLTFERIPAYVYLREDQTLNRLMVTAGMASSTKGGELGR